MPMRLLVATPLHLYLLDLGSGRLTELRSGDGEYYGLTWRRDALLVAHSNLGNEEEFLAHKAPPMIDGGVVASYSVDGRIPARTPRRLLLAHQIEWADDRLLVVDTGRERLSVYAADNSLIRDVALGDLSWDHGHNGQMGHHFNSVHRSGDRVWIVAHNHDRPSEVWELSWPELEIVQVHITGAAWAHNVWDGPLGLIICDSFLGRLHEVRSGETIWAAEEESAITRGLAVDVDHLFIGRSEFGGRGERRVNDGGLWVVDRATLTTIERFRFPGSGCVNEIRLLDSSDECHNDEPFDDRLLAGLSHLHRDRTMRSTGESCPSGNSGGSRKLLSGARQSDTEVGRGIESERIDAYPTCFLHIPKSAGSRILSALEAALPPGSLAPQHFDSSHFCDFEDFELLRPEARSQIAANPREVRSLGQYRAISGHFSLTTLLQISRATSISTVLREPRARLLSLYMYWRTLNIGDFWAPYRVSEHAGRPLSAFLSEPRLAPVVDNQMCRILLHGDPRLPESSFAAPSDIEAIAADAIRLLDGLGFVGILELGDSAWRGVAQLFDVTLDPIKVSLTGEPVRGAAGESEETPFMADVLDLVEQRNAADLLIYDYALTRAGLGTHERQRLGDRAFAHQLVKLGDLIGHSAAQAAEQAGVVEVLRSQLQERERLHVELDETRDRLHMHERTVHESVLGLQDEVRRREEDLYRLRRWLDAVHASASWRLTVPLRAAKDGVQRLGLASRRSAISARDKSLLARLSIGQVWWFALILSSIIAATDAVLSHVILIVLLAAGPFCGLLTGRWTRTATAGMWAVALAVPLCIPDKIWGTSTQLRDLSTVASVALLSTFAAIVIERRRYGQTQ